MRRGEASRNLRAAHRFAQGANGPRATRVEGIALLLYRTALGVPARDVAMRMGVSGQRVAAIEATAWVPIETAQRYREAVDGAEVPA